MSPMTMIEPYQTIGIPILTNPNDEEFGEEIVALFIARANALRHSQALSDLCVGIASGDLRPHFMWNFSAVARQVKSRKCIENKQA